MKSKNSKLAFIAGIGIGLAALSVACFMMLKKFFPLNKNNKNDEATGTDSGIPCCTLEDVEPPPDPAVGSPAE